MMPLCQYRDKPQVVRMAFIVLEANHVAEVISLLIARINLGSVHGLIRRVRAQPWDERLFD